MLIIVHCTNLTTVQMHHKSDLILDLQNQQKNYELMLKYELWLHLYWPDLSITWAASGWLPTRKYTPGPIRILWVFQPFSKETCRTQSNDSPISNRNLLVKNSCTETTLYLPVKLLYTHDAYFGACPRMRCWCPESEGTFWKALKMRHCFQSTLKMEGSKSSSERATASWMRWLLEDSHSNNRERLEGSSSWEVIVLVEPCMQFIVHVH